jgi:NitT/TauT family transport system substrate-binding protein
MLHRRHLIAAAGGAALALPAMRTARAQSALRFTLDWALQGNHGMWALAEDRGIYRREGLAGADGPRLRVGRRAGEGGLGAYDVGFADFAGAVKFNAENPQNRLVMIYPVFDRTAAAVVTLRGRDINRPQDVAGRSLGAPEGEGSRLLFPAFARVAAWIRAACAGPPWRRTCATRCCARARWMR